MQLSQTQDVQQVHHWDYRKTWRHTDAAGHEHYYDASTPGSPFPTLEERSEHVPCDDPECGCDGHERTWYVCIFCGETVSPAVEPTTAYIAGRTHYCVDGVEVSAEEYRRRLDEAISGLVPDPANSGG
jgi:hypothetical protein